MEFTEAVNVAALIITPLILTGELLHYIARALPDSATSQTKND